MNIVFNAPFVDGTTKQYVYNEEKFRKEKNIPEEYMGAGFIITSKDGKKFYIGAGKYPDGSGHGFVEDFNPDLVQVGSNPDYLIQLARSIDANVSINAIFTSDLKEPYSKDEYIWFPLPFHIETDSVKNLALARINPLSNTLSSTTFEWENTLVHDEENYLGKLYPDLKAYMKTLGYDTLDLHVLNAMVRTYKGPAIDCIIYDIVKLAPNADALNDVVRHKLGTPNCHQYVLDCYEALKNDLPLPKHPFEEYLPHLEDCIYKTVLSIRNFADYFAKMIAHYMKFSGKSPYTPAMDAVFATMIFNMQTLSTSSIKDSPDFIEFKKYADKEVQPMVIYRSQPHSSISKLKQLVALADIILSRLEDELFEKVGVKDDLLITKQTLKKELTEVKNKLDNLYTNRGRLENTITNDHQLNTARMNLNNVLSKIKKLEDAHKKQKVTDDTYEYRLSEFAAKRDKIQGQINAAKSQSFEQIKEQKNIVSAQIKELTEKSKSIEAQLHKLPKSFEVSDSLREFFKVI